MFDSLAYVKKLKSVGVPEAQAEAYAEILVEFASDTLLKRVIAISEDIKWIKTLLERKI